MNYIEVKGGTISQQEKVHSMVEYCINKLMPRMRTLEIEVQIKNIEKKEDADGYCLRNSPREFELEISNNQGLRKMLETVAHEMVHVKQYARNEMNDWVHDSTREKYYKWKGTSVPEKTNYWDLPWEIEANGMEVGLFVRWAKERGFDKQAWTQI